VIHQADGGREEEWAGHQQMEVERRSGRGISRAMASDPARSNGPYETWSQGL